VALKKLTANLGRKWQCSGAFPWGVSVEKKGLFPLAYRALRATVTG